MTVDVVIRQISIQTLTYAIGAARQCHQFRCVVQRHTIFERQAFAVFNFSNNGRQCGRQCAHKEPKLYFKSIRGEGFESDGRSFTFDPGSNDRCRDWSQENTVAIVSCGVNQSANTSLSQYRQSVCGCRTETGPHFANCERCG